VRVLVTGGAGAIGSILVEALLARGDEVAVLDSFHDFYPRAQKERNLARARGQRGFAGVFEGDIRDVEFVAKTFESFAPRAVVHLAAISNDPIWEWTNTAAVDQAMQMKMTYRLYW
jgi:UDP-glucuronate 4-epimerase